MDTNTDQLARLNAALRTADAERAELETVAEQTRRNGHALAALHFMREADAWTDRIDALEDRRAQLLRIGGN